MKLGPPLTSAKVRALSVLLVSLFAVWSAYATDGIYNKFNLDLGYAGRIGYSGGTTPHWAIFVYGAGTASSRFNALDISAPPGSTPPQVDGNIALAGAYSTFTISGLATVVGDRYEQTTSTESNSGGTLTGTRYQSTSINTQLNSGVASLIAVSNAAAALTATAGSPTSINAVNAGQTLFFNNTPFGGKYVMNLTDFVLGGGGSSKTGGAILTLNGVAGSAFVINVSRNFNIGGGAQILLTGGLTPSDVLFNIRGNNAGTTGALNFEIGGDAVFNGTLLAYNSSGTQRTLMISGHNTRVTGEVIANKLIFSSGGHITHPKKKSEE